MNIELDQVSAGSGRAIVDVAYWNPRRRIVHGKLGRVLPRRRVNNFGDLLGPIIVKGLIGSRIATGTGSPDHAESSGDRDANGDATLLSVGSIMHFAKTGDTVWGTGVNGKEPVENHRFTSLDVRAVRGPRTRAFLQERSIEAPEVYGDPALLLPQLYPQLLEWASEKRHVTTIVPNLHDLSSMRGQADVLSPKRPVFECLERIARSERVIASSLHGIVVAESLGIPAVLVKPSAEPLFKYQDYFEGTGRPEYPLVSTFGAADGASPLPPLNWDSAPLLDAFPIDLWA